MKENIKVQGYVLLDVDVVALNNAGKDTMSNFDNAVKTKSIYKNGLNYVYVSGQAWRFWWREALQKNVGWTLSPVIRDKNIAFTTANPLTYPDDDIFGYMRAATEEYEEKGKKNKKYNCYACLSAKKFSFDFCCFYSSCFKLVKYGTSKWRFSSICSSRV